jgi:hypothetical protein
MQLPFLRATALTLLLSLFSLNAHAALGDDLDTLTADLGALDAQLSAFSFAAGNDCAELGTLNTSIANYIASVDAVSAQLASPLSLTTSDLTSLDELATTSLSMADEMVRLSWELRNVEDVYELFEYRAALSAMLELSDDIGTMAGRILEMADRILVMADNIGLMADRILLTQQLQNQNVALTQAAILTTQQNMVALSDSLSTIVYNLTLGQIENQTEALSIDMDGVTLTATNMASELAMLETTTASALTTTVDLYTWAMESSQGASHYINGDTLTLLGDLTYLHRALALSLENYARAIETLAPVTDTVVLRDATAAMLRLSADIGAMSDRIMEMTDKIIVMADNIGVMADRIVETQNIQQTNIELTESSILTAQTVTLTVIRNMGL